MNLRHLLADELEAVRRRSLDLLEPLDDGDLRRQHSPIMSPLVWDLAHVGNFEELWLLREVAGAEPIDRALDDIYDAFRHPRPNRPSLPLLSPAESRRYLVDVRGRALDHLERADLDGGPARPLLAGGYVYGMVVQHEHQHDETMLATLQLMAGDGYRPLAPPPPEVVEPPPSGEVLVAAGPFVMGTESDRWAPFAWEYDNERPAHVVDLPAYRIDAAPVTNGRFLEFVLDGGYDQPQLWAAEGWTWRQEHEVVHPQFWVDEGAGDWSRVRFGLTEDLPLDEPVQHVCWYEADAFARWAGKRLPTEAEWEKAASWGPDGVKRLFPWGDGPPTADVANLGQTYFRPAPVGAYPAGASANGCHQMIGDVWEWTSSDFEPYPGFASFPYREYSEVFFGESYKVLRGGSWATSPLAVRSTFRNWDHPIRRQIFSGFRCARST